MSAVRTIPTGSIVKVRQFVSLSIEHTLKTFVLAGASQAVASPWIRGPQLWTAILRRVVSLSESPLRLRLSWKKGPKDSARLVGIFDLDLEQLLKAGYIRYEPKSEDEVRLRFYHDWDNLIKIQVNSNGPGLPIGRVPSFYAAKQNGLRERVFSTNLLAATMAHMMGHVVMLTAIFFGV